MGLRLFKSYMVSLPSPRQLIVGLSANQGQQSNDLNEAKKKRNTVQQDSVAGKSSNI